MLCNSHATRSPLTVQRKAQDFRPQRDTDLFERARVGQPRSPPVTQRGAATAKSCHPERPLTLPDRLISALSETEFQPENYEDEYRKRLLKAIEQKIAGQEIERVEVEARPPTTDLVATLKASLGRKGLAKASSTRSAEPTPAKRPARRRRAS
jgi:hypothetical protein